VPLSLADEADFEARIDAFDPTGTRIGWLGDLAGYLPFEAGILETCERALHRLRDGGCEIERARPNFAADAVWGSWLVLRRWLVGARIATFLAHRENRASIKPEALWEHDGAAKLTGADVIRASAVRSEFYRQMLVLLERYDFLALPSAQAWPFDAGLRWPREIAGRSMDTYHRWMEVVIYATFAGLPCISVPAGFGETGLPMGLQLIGGPRGDLRVLQLARAYEQVARDIVDVRPKR